MFICRKYNVTCTMLYDYINRRDQILADFELTKRQILVALNSDNPKRIRGNQWYNTFISQLAEVKQKLFPIIRDEHNIHTKNSKNPISSTITSYLCYIENEILQHAIEEMFGDHCGVPMFDGCMVSRDFCEECQLQDKIEELDYMFDVDYHGLIKWAVKPTTSDVVIAEVQEGPQPYDEAKVRFEEDHFLTLSPYAFWKKHRTRDGTYAFSQLKESEFRNACKEYQVLSFNADDKVNVSSIFEEWIRDPNKRKYECVDFVPYGLEDNCPSYVFNTFDGFEVNKRDDYNDVDTSNFDTLIFNLCGEDRELTEYTMKYIAHMFQYPNRRTDKILVFISWTGCGKDTLFRTLQALMGNRYVDITENMDSVFGQFNDILDSKICLFMNEVEGKQGYGYVERLKGQATTKDNKVNSKHSKVVFQSNYARLFIFSNNDGCVQVQVNDRRFTVLKASLNLVANQNDKMKASEVKEFWDRYYANLESFDWRKSLYNKLMRMDLRNFNPKYDAPNTKEREVMREKNIHPLFYYFNDILNDKQYIKDEFITHRINGKEINLIRWSNFIANYKGYIESKYSEDKQYKVKDAVIKQKIFSMDPEFIPSRRIVAQGKTERFASMSLETIKKFLKNHVFEPEDHSNDIIMDTMPQENGLAPGFTVFERADSVCSNSSMNLSSMCL